MAWRQFTASREIGVPPVRAFEFVADYRNVPDVLEGVSRWEPVGRRRAGRGARFEVEMRTLGFPIGNVLVLDEWEPARRISWHSEAGLVEQRGGWSFDEVTVGVLVTLQISYRPPGAALGNLLAGRVDSLVRGRLVRALEEMGRRLESEQA